MKNEKRFLKLLCLPLLTTWAVSALAQNKPTAYAKEAQKLAKYGKISEAIAHWKQDYAITKDHWNAYEIANLYAISQSKDSAFVWLYEAAKSDSSLTILTDDHFYSMLETPEWRAFENQQIKKYETKNDKIKNIALAIKLWHISMKDQAFSYEINLANRTLGDTSPISIALQKLQDMNRKENLVEMEAIMDKYGWPKKSEVGDLAAEASFYVVQHSQGEKARKKYLSKLKKACKKKEAEWTDYAAMYDRLALAETGKQRYGTQMRREEFNGKIELCPLESPEFVEKRRREIGLTPLIPILKNLEIPFNVVQME